MLVNALCVIWCGRMCFFFSGIGCGLPVVSGCVVVSGAQ